MFFIKVEFLILFDFRHGGDDFLAHFSEESINFLVRQTQPINQLNSLEVVVQTFLGHLQLVRSNRFELIDDGRQLIESRQSFLGRSLLFFQILAPGCIQSSAGSKCTQS